MIDIDSDILWDEQEILDGMRSWAKSQEIFAAGPADESAPIRVLSSWYDTSVDSHTGAFAVVQENAGLDDWVGEVLQVSYGKKMPIYVYVVGTTPDIETPFALQRTAAIRVINLGHDDFQVFVQVTG